MMRPSSRLALLAFAFVAPMTAPAQTLNGGRATWYTNFTYHVPNSNTLQYNPASCQGVQDGTSAAAPVSGGGTCTQSGSVPGQYYNSSTGRWVTQSFDIGNLQTTSSLSITPGSSVYADGYMTGTLGANVTAIQSSVAGYFTKVSIANPTNISSVLLTANWSAAGTGFGGSLDTYAIDADGTLGGELVADGGFDPMGNPMPGQPYSVSFDPTSDSPITLAVPWSVVSSGTFAYYMLAQEYDVQSAGSTSTFLNGVGGGAILWNPRLTLYDGESDVTADHAITYSTTATTSTPEPASLTLLGTGLAGLLGIARRKRR